MLYPKSIEEKLGFDKIRQLLNEECQGELGRKFVHNMHFVNEFEQVKKLLSQTNEFKRIMETGESFPSQHFYDTSAYLAKAEIEGIFLTEQEFYEIKLSLGTLVSCLMFFSLKEERSYPNLKELSAQISVDPAIIKKLNSVIDETGKMRSNASPLLKELRDKIIAEQVRLRNLLDNFLKTCKKSGYSTDDVEITIRNGRMVIPVLAEHRKNVKGFVQDKSGTGQTLFMEPEQALDINNEIKDLEFRERNEVIRILTQLTSELRPALPALAKAYRFLGILDFVRAKAKLAVKMEACMPSFEKQTIISWRNARHPLLFLSFKEQGRQVVPQSISLDTQTRILLISGPNAGGKSVCLKTVALIQYMWQCGLLVPVAENSEMGLFRDILLDIGDEQSLENDLSTYSSHLTNMRHFLRHADKHSLFFIDEFGAGTEPQFGAAIAEAILEQLVKQKAFGIINTHYANLKLFANSNQGIVNGAMRFDMNTLTPLFELEIGQPGSSFALEIAQKIGLPKEVVEASRQKLGSKQLNVENLLRDLEKERKSLYEQRKESSIKETILSKKIKEYEEKDALFNKNKQKWSADAKIEAKKVLQEANRKVENTLRQIIESKGEKEVVKELRKELKKFDESIVIEDLNEEKELKDFVKPVEGKIILGDFVRVIDNDAIGEVVGLKEGEAQVMIGSLKSNIKLKRLQKISKKEFKKSMKEKDVTYAMNGIDLSKRMADFSPELDIRGKRAEEALQLVQDFLDNAIMLNQPSLRILHGKGDGILREIIRNLLRNYPQVQRFADEHPDRGGAGLTVVEF